MNPEMPTPSQEREPRKINLFNPEVEETFRNHGEIFRRKIEEPLQYVEQVTETKMVETVLKDGTEETGKKANPGDWIVKGSEGELFVIDKEEFAKEYELQSDGRYYSKEKLITAVKNPYNEPIKITAPWSAFDQYILENGAKNCFMIIVLDENGQYTNKRYLIGNESLLLGNYEFTRKSLAVLLADAEAALIRSRNSELHLDENAFAVLLEWQKAAEAEAERTPVSGALDVILSRAELFLRVGRISFAKYDLSDAELLADNDPTISNDLRERLASLKTQIKSSTTDSIDKEFKKRYFSLIL
jgi:hypothetical protein